MTAGGSVPEPPLHHKPSDSAGVPWEGRKFEQESSSDDDGSAPAGLARVLTRFHSGGAAERDVVDSIRESRLLIPLVAVAGDTGVNGDGVIIDKSQELSIVTVAGPDGRSVLPVFTSVAAMFAWNPLARPVPASGPRVALAAASEGTDVVVIDATGPLEFAVRRPALWALARGLDWQASYLDEEVRSTFTRAAAAEQAVIAVQLAAGDPGARLAGPELVVQLSLAPGLDQAQLDGLVGRLQQRWARDEIIAARVDSLSVRLVS